MQDFYIEEFLLHLKKAISKVGDEYYTIKTIYDSDGIIRERVFCYELYHQFRNLPPQGFQYAFHGELDKRGHLLFEPEEQKIPDFLVHTPGTMDENKVIIEVKGKIDRNDVVNDIKKIFSFLTKVDYEYGVFLLFNHSFEELQQRIPPISLSDIDCQEDANIFIVCTSPNDGALTCNTLGELRNE
jgi:hypothetical protein